MVLKIIDAIQAKPGSTIMVDGEPCVVRSNDISKSGKHGASKCRIEAIEIFSDKKKVIAVPGHERFDVPMVEKRKAQVLSVGNDTASVMDLDNYETLEMLFSPELKEQLAAQKEVEYWDIEGRKLIKRVL